MSEERKFQEVLKEIRKDLVHISNLYQMLVQKTRSNYEVTQELKEWIYDTFLDKVYETNAKQKTES